MYIDDCIRSIVNYLNVPTEQLKKRFDWTHTGNNCCNPRGDSPSWHSLCLERTTWLRWVSHRKSWLRKSNDAFPTSPSPTTLTHDRKSVSQLQFFSFSSSSHFQVVIPLSSRLVAGSIRRFEREERLGLAARARHLAACWRHVWFPRAALPEAEWTTAVSQTQASDSQDVLEIRLGNFWHLSIEFESQVLDWCDKLWMYMFM